MLEKSKNICLLEVILVNVLFLVLAISVENLYAKNQETGIQNSVHLVCKSDFSRLSKREIKGATDRNCEIISNRLNEIGNVAVYKLGTDRIIIQFPQEDEERTKELIGKRSYLELRFVDKKRKHPDAAVEILRTWHKDLKYRVCKEAVLKGDAIVDTKAEVDSVSGRPCCIVCSLSSRARRSFAHITGASVGKLLAIVIDGIVVSTYRVTERNASGVFTIIDDFTEEYVYKLASILRSGALASPVLIIEERKVSGPIGFNFTRGGMIVDVTFKESLSSSDIERKLTTKGIDCIVQEVGLRGKGFLIWLEGVQSMDKINKFIADIGGSVNRAEIAGPRIWRGEDVPDEIKRQIEEVIDKYIKAYNRKDYNYLCKFFKYSDDLREDEKTKKFWKQALPEWFREAGRILSYKILESSQKGKRVFLGIEFEYGKAGKQEVDAVFHNMKGKWILISGLL